MDGSIFDFGSNRIFGPLPHTSQVRGFERRIFHQILSQRLVERVYEDAVLEDDKDFLNRTKTTKIKSMEVLRKIKSEINKKMTTTLTMLLI